MKKNAILFSASNYTKSPLIQIDDLPGVKYDIQAMHKRLTQIGFEVKQIENISKNQIVPALEDNASHSPCDAIHIVYFTGHGGHNNGNNYIYPVDFASFVFYIFSKFRFFSQIFHAVCTLSDTTFLLALILSMSSKEQLFFKITH